MTIPNLISAGRILLVPLFVMLCRSGLTAPAVAVLLLSALSDVLDGYIARRFDMVTELGKLLDPVADKLMQAAMLLCAALERPELWLLLGLHALRELWLGALGLRVLRLTGRVYGARWYGKLCTAVIYAVMLPLLAFPALPAALLRAGVLLCAALMLLCLCLYTLSYLRILRDIKKA